MDTSKNVENPGAASAASRKKTSPRGSRKAKSAPPSPEPSAPAAADAAETPREACKVAKFGGSSLATAARIKHVADIVLRDASRRFIVVSAPGKAHPKDEKITDLLIQCAHNRLSGGAPGAPLETIRTRYTEIGRELGIAAPSMRRVFKELDQVVGGDVSNPSAYKDAVKAMGEELMAQIFADYLREVRKQPAQYVGPRESGLVVTEEFGDAFPLPEAAKNLEKNLAGRPGLTVFPGFYGITKKGQMATFSRGGSDFTGAIVAESVDADVYENWTDVDGILRADPSIIPNAEIIHEITYREIRELAYMGFKVLHHDAILPVRRKHIPINLRNTNNINFPGTMIVDSRIALAEVLVGVAVKKGFCCFNVEKYLMNREIGFGRRLLGILEDSKLSFEHMPSGIDSVSVYLDQSQLQGDMSSQIIRRIYRDLRADKVEVEHDKAMVIAVGEGMKRHMGVAAKLVNALATSKVNIEVINQGASELSILLGVRNEDGEPAVRAIYDAFFGAPRNGGALKNGDRHEKH
jgi:aspartate kinase